MVLIPGVCGEFATPETAPSFLRHTFECERISRIETHTDLFGKGFLHQVRRDGAALPAPPDLRHGRELIEEVVEAELSLFMSSEDGIISTEEREEKERKAVADVLNRSQPGSVHRLMDSISLDP